MSAPASNRDLSPPEGFPTPEPDSDRDVGSLVELNARLGALGQEMIRLHTAVNAESTARRAAEYDLAERDGRLASGLMSLGQALYDVREEVKREIAGIKGEIGDMREALFKEIVGLHRTDSIHDEAVTETRLAVVKQQTALEKLMQKSGPGIAVGAVVAVVIKLLDALIHLPDILKALGGH